MIAYQASESPYRNRDKSTNSIKPSFTLPHAAGPS